MQDGGTTITRLVDNKANLNGVKVGDQIDIYLHRGDAGLCKARAVVDCAGVMRSAFLRSLDTH
jgi:hypothetical protein